MCSTILCAFSRSSDTGCKTVWCSCRQQLRGDPERIWWGSDARKQVKFALGTSMSVANALHCQPIMTLWLLVLGSLNLEWAVMLYVCRGGQGFTSMPMQGQPQPQPQQQRFPSGNLSNQLQVITCRKT